MAENSSIVVLVEDNAADARLTQRVLEHYFQSRAFVTEHFTNIGDARDYLATKGQDVTLVLLDLNLPDTRDASDTFESIKEYARDIPIVVLTGTKDQSIAMTLVHGGAEDFISKDVLNVTPELLSRSIDFAIGRHKKVQDMHAAMKETEAQKDMLIAWMGGNYSAS